MPDPNDTESETDATHRLKRIVVQEVSLVDRAANGRIFLLKKRADLPMTTTISKEDPAAAVDAAAQNAAAEALSNPTTSSPGGEAPANAMQAQVKDSLLSALTGVCEKLVAIAGQVDGMSVTDQATDPAVPADITGQIAEAAKALGEIASQYGAVTPVAASEGGETPATSTAEKAAACGEDEQAMKAVDEAEAEVEKRGLVVSEHPELVAKSVAVRLGVSVEKAAETIARVSVAKVGRRMAKSRLESFLKALSMLSGLAKELQDETKAAGPDEGEDGAKEAEVTKALETSKVEALLSSTDELISIAKSAHDEATELRSKLAAAHSKIAMLEKSTAAANSFPVETMSGGSGAHARVTWPMDLAPASKR